MISGLKVERAMTPLTTAMAFAVAAFAAATVIAVPAASEAQVRSNAQAEQSRAIAVRSSRPGHPLSGRYVSESGEAFIFDGTGARPLFRFERRNETWVLRTTPAPRGDVIYRNDAGSQILRLTPSGGLTLYTTRAPNGSPATLSGGAAPLNLPPITPTQLITYSIQQSGRMSAALGHLVVVDVELERPGLESVVAETITVVTEAILRMSRSATVRDQVGELRRIQIQEANRGSVRFSDGTLIIAIAGDQGLQGRPSSALIIRAVANGD
jgi:hypothetical protein